MQRFSMYVWRQAETASCRYRGRCSQRRYTIVRNHTAQRGKRLKESKQASKEEKKKRRLGGELRQQVERLDGMRWSVCKAKRGSRDGTRWCRACQCGRLGTVKYNSYLEQSRAKLPCLSRKGRKLGVGMTLRFVCDIVLEHRQKKFFCVSGEMRHVVVLFCSCWRLFFSSERVLQQWCGRGCGSG